MTTTAPPPFELAALLPELEPLRTGTVRLHPRKFAGLPPNVSKMGGAVLDDATLAWPRCDEHATPFVPVMQVLARDVPSIVFPEGKSALQVLWCPFEHRAAVRRHEPSLLTRLELRWLDAGASRAVAVLRDAASASPQERLAEKRALRSVPDLTTHTVGAGASLLVVECALSPELVSEYPSVHELPPACERLLESCDALASLGRELDAASELPASDAYGTWFGAAPGTKLGGHVHWIQGPETPRCCGTMEHLLTLASVEWGDGWRPVEPEEQAHRQDAALCLGDAGSLYVFVCKKHTPWNHRWAFQCS